MYCGGTGLISKEVRQHRDATPTPGTATINFGYIPASDEDALPISSTQTGTHIPDEDVVPDTSLGYERPKDVTGMDKTRNYGYPSREDGRYGSHPSHDAFDDESKP
jgi:hypothetical protein